MDRFIEVNGVKYDVDAERDAATQALLDAGETDARIYVIEDGEERATVSVLRDSGTIGQVGR